MAVQDTKVTRSAPAPVDIPESVLRELAENPASSFGNGAEPRVSTFADLSPFVGTWSGDDLDELLADVYAVRGEAEF